MRAAASLVAILLVGCGGGSSTPVDAGTPTPDAFDTAPPPAGTVRFQMALSIASGGETHKCMMVRMPSDGGGVVVRMAHHYTPGSHHLLLFRTNLSAIPAGFEQMVDCYEGGTGIMRYARGILYGSQIPNDEAALPPDIGLSYADGEILIFQTHYINATEAALDAHVTVDLATARSDSVSQRAGVLLYYDPFIDVPPRDMARAQMRCTMPSDIRILKAFSHYHRRGVAFEAYLDPDRSTLTTAPFYASADWEHPANLAQPIDVKAGNAIRFWCGYDNRDGDNEYFQGESAELNEMCLFSGIYYPQMDTASEFCFTGADMFGTGTATCGQTLLCLSTCRSSGLPPITPSGQFPVDSCLQKCVVESCPSASGLILGGLKCLQRNCLSTCAQGGSACLQCLQTSCPTELNSCLSSTCN